MNRNVDELRALQHPDRSFAPIVTSRSGRCLDYNGFVAATVLRLLRNLPEGPARLDRTSSVALSSTC
jgi:hypothetical protein